ncbi:hypothetical protein ACJX0J_015113, partial [Zea mays]
VKPNILYSLYHKLCGTILVPLLLLRQMMTTCLVYASRSFSGIWFLQEKYLKTTILEYYNFETCHNILQKHRKYSTSKHALSIVKPNILYSLYHKLCGTILVPLLLLRQMMTTCLVYASRSFSGIWFLQEKALF